jgi:hypothetical protein
MGCTPSLAITANLHRSPPGSVRARGCRWRSFPKIWRPLCGSSRSRGKPRSAQRLSGTRLTVLQFLAGGRGPVFVLPLGHGSSSSPSRSSGQAQAARTRCPQGGARAQAGADWSRGRGTDSLCRGSGVGFRGDWLVGTMPRGSDGTEKTRRGGEKRDKGRENATLWGAKPQNPCRKPHSGARIPDNALKLPSPRGCNPSPRGAAPHRAGCRSSTCAGCDLRRATIGPVSGARDVDAARKIRSGSLLARSSTDRAPAWRSGRFPVRIRASKGPVSCAKARSASL